MDLPRRTLLTVGAAAGAANLLSQVAAEAAPRVDKVLATHLKVPWGIAFLPGGEALVTERFTAKVLLIGPNGGKSYVDTITGVDDDAGEGGLLGCVASPDFVDTGHVFFYLTSGTDNRVIQMTYDGTGLGERTTILDSIQRGVRTHDGGRLQFGPDGKLYITTGDARDDSTSQDLTSLAGKILRINGDGTVPDDNPFGDSPVWTYGHRNVQGLAWDGNGQAWASEFGENTKDELNRITAGANYGWPQSEGGDGPGGTHDPFVTWQPTSTCSPSGLAIARGKAWVGALAGHCVYSVDLHGTGKRTIKRHLHEKYGRIRSVEAAPDGSLWVTTSNRDGRGTPARPDDRILRLRV